MDQIQNEWVWWKHGIIYHIYPLSFFDSNNDGKGDLRGIILKLDYLKDLGIEAIWLSPIFQSPMADFGYDVSDYYAIDPVFGTFDDFKELLLQAHERNIKVILDIVLNHTSENHQWFIESRKDKTNPKRSWYIWQPANDNRKPNNWKNAFGGSCWEYDKVTGEYYLHSFLKEQPDLNWRNKEVRNEMFMMLNYWQELGVDGFRFDVINFIVKDKKLRNNPFLFWLSSERKIRTRNHDKSYRIIRKLRKALDKYPDCTSVGEIYALPPGDPKLSASYLKKDKNLLHLTFDFSIFFVHWSAQKYFKTIEKWQSSIHEEGWPTNVFSNHDLFRAFNRYGIGRHKKQKARLQALMLMTLKGTPFIYYGDEIGMKNIKIPRKSLKDPLGKRYWPLFKGRDRARTPMQWNESKNSGFSEVRPWLPIDNDCHKVNVEQQNNYADSQLNLYRRLIDIRHKYPALYKGEWIPDCDGKRGILSYYRKTETEYLLVVLNFTSQGKNYFRKFNNVDKLIFSTMIHSEKLIDPHFYTLQAYEGIIVQLGS
jgi:alpha-glucosidase